MTYQSIYRGEVALCAAAIVASLAMACHPYPTRSNSPQLMATVSAAEPKADAAGIDHHAEEQLKTKKADAKTWLASDKHVVWKWDRADAAKAVDELLKLGATKVWIADINTTDDNAEVASTFVVELPAKDKAAARKAVFAWIEKWEDKADIDENLRSHDVGQKYWVLDTDL